VKRSINMKRLLVAVLGLGLLAMIAWAANNAASGTGAIVVSDKSNGQIDFSVAQRGDVVRGSLVFVELIPGRRPVYLANISMKVERAGFSGNTATLVGSGTLNRQPVRVEVKVADNHSRTGGDPDFFSIVATSRDGTQVYGARGPLFRGDIKVKSGQ
jgi:hypothetical protein